MTKVLISALAIVIAGVLLEADPAEAQGDPASRQAFFGETHLHTSWSLDAWVFGNHVTGPADAYKYAKGRPSSIRSATTSPSARRSTSWA